MKLQRMGLLSVATVCVFSFQNCEKSKVHFDDIQLGQTSSDPNSSPEGSADSSSTATPVSSSSGVASKMEFQISSCSAQSTCVAYVRLFPASPVKVAAQWKTDDTRYQSGERNVAKPNVDYAPTGGELVFNENDSAWKSIRVQSLSNTTIQIPFEIFDCKEGGQLVDCGKYE